MTGASDANSSPWGTFISSTKASEQSPGGLGDLRHRGPDDVRHRVPWKVDGEYASHARDVAHADDSLVRLDAAARDRQPQPEAAAIGALLREGHEHLLRIARREASAIVLDIDQDSIARCVGVQRDLRSVVGELECVLQQV